MKNYLSLFLILVSFQSFAQKDWKKETSTTYAIQHPDTWIVRTTESPTQIMVSGATPDFKESSEYIGTTLFVTSEPSTFATIDSANIAYKQKLMATDFMEKIVIQKEEKIKFKGVDAVAITFTAKIQHYSTACRIIIFQRNDIYYELSVSYDQKLSKKLLNEAYSVMETFEFTD